MHRVRRVEPSICNTHTLILEPEDEPSHWHAGSGWHNPKLYNEFGIICRSVPVPTAEPSGYSDACEVVVRVAPAYLRREILQNEPVGSS